MLSFSCRFGIFPINVYAIESEVLYEFHGGRSEFLARGGGGGGDGEVGGVCPAADREEDF